MTSDEPFSVSVASGSDSYFGGVVSALLLLCRLASRGRSGAVNLVFISFFFQTGYCVFVKL